MWRCDAFNSWKHFPLLFLSHQILNLNWMMDTKKRHRHLIYCRCKSLEQESISHSSKFSWWRRVYHKCQYVAWLQTPNGDIRVQLAKIYASISRLYTSWCACRRAVLTIKKWTRSYVSFDFILSTILSLAISDLLISVEINYCIVRYEF